MFSFSSLFMLSCGLAMDATAVAASRGLLVPTLRFHHYLRVALFFGGFQALMPLLGWLWGHELGPLFAAIDHWIAFGLLFGLGGKMLWEARHADDEAPLACENFFGLRTMAVLAVATSIDAFAAGIMLPVLGAPLGLSLATIGVTTAMFSMAGLWAGRRFGAMLGRRLDVLGGVMLIALGFKILVQHLSAENGL